MRPASYVADLKPEAVKDEIFPRRSKSSSTTLWGRWIGPQVATTASSALSFQAVQNVRRSRTHPCPWFRSEEHTSELQSLMRISYAVFCLKKKKKKTTKQ